MKYALESFRISVAMDSLSSSLKPLNFGLSFSGCPIFPSKYRLVNYITRIYGLFLLIFLPPTFIADVDVGILEDHPLLVKLMMRFWHLCFLFCTGLFIILIRFKRTKIGLLLDCLEKTLSPRDHKDIFRLSITLFFFTGICHFGFVVLILAIRFKNEYFNAWFSINMIINWAFSLSYFWFPISINLYICLLKVVHVSERNLINRFEQDISKIHDPKKVYRLLIKLLDIKNGISDSVSILPFCCFCYLLIETVASVCRHQIVYFDSRSTSLDKSFSVFCLFRAFNDMLMVIYLTFRTDSFCRESSLKLESLEKSIISNKDPNEWSFVVGKIKESQHFSYKAFNSFKINQNSLLVFSSSFVSLSVLFVQLIINQNNIKT